MAPSATHIVALGGIRMMSTLLPWVELGCHKTKFFGLVNVGVILTFSFAL